MKIIKKAFVNVNKTLPSFYLFFFFLSLIQINVQKL